MSMEVPHKAFTHEVGSYQTTTIVRCLRKKLLTIWIVVHVNESDAEQGTELETRNSIESAQRQSSLENYPDCKSSAGFQRPHCPEIP
jgi:hypothetical protein